MKLTRHKDGTFTLKFNRGDERDIVYGMLQDAISNHDAAAKSIDHSDPMAARRLKAKAATFRSLRDYMGGYSAYSTIESGKSVEVVW